MHVEMNPSDHFKDKHIKQNSRNTRKKWKVNLPEHCPTMLPNE
jgi:hypothetical protein